MRDQVLVEICVDSIASAIAAQRGGAGRLELCSGLNEGGITPSAGLIEAVRAKTSIPLHVIIRPRAGDFCYTAEEFETMQRDVVAAKKLGADGVVLGMLNADGTVDTARTQRLIALARPLAVTFHRAFDMSADLFRALEEVCTAGADRLLTSGGEVSAEQGSQVIARLVQAARGRVTVMACGGINASNAASIIERTCVREIHAGLRRVVASPMLHHNSKVSIGAITGREYARFEVLEEDVVNLCREAAEVRKPECPPSS